MVFSSMFKSWLRAGGCEGFLQLLWESITWFGQQLTNRQIATSLKNIQFHNNLSALSDSLFPQ